ncbi:MAG TPA: hypothetical protein VEK11_22655 [Thermoanaerobaculia bacterium]|nr:hypothetical protein [Thermoanaerobaculia bacterium]
MGKLIEFPLRRVCALGVPPEIVSQMRRQLAHVSVSVDASTLQRADLLVIGEEEPRAFDFVAWVRRISPAFPILYWTGDVAAAALAERCRLALG